MSQANTPPRIVLVGHVCIDHNTSESATYTSWGSSVIYMSQYLQQAYTETPLVVTNYGPDLVPYLPEIHLLPEQPNQLETLRYENDTRQVPRIWKAYNTAFATAPALTPEVVTAVQQADMLLVATLLPNYDPSYIAALLSYAKPGCLKVLCPQGYFRHIADDGLVIPRDFSEAEQIVPLFDVVVYSTDDTPEAFATAERWLRQAPDTNIVITQGPEGATIVRADGRQHIPTTPLALEDIVDSVGCGDVFAGTLAYAYNQTHDLASSIKTAHQAAARKLTATVLERLP
jgi:hypothetical protein